MPYQSFLQTSFVVTSKILSLNFSPDNQKLWVFLSDGTVRSWQIATGEERLCWTAPLGAKIGLAFDQTGQANIIVATRAAPLKVLAAQTLEVLAYYHYRLKYPEGLAPNDYQALAVAYDAQNQLRLLDDNWWQKIYVWDVENDQKLLSLKASTERISLSADAKYVICDNKAGKIEVWLSQEDQRAFTFKTKNISSAAFFSPDCEYAINLADSKQLQIWQTRARQPLFSLKQPVETLEAATFSYDNHQIALATQAKILQIWRWNEFELRELAAHTSHVTSVNYSSDNCQIVSASSDKSVKIWNESGQVEVNLTGHHDIVWQASFSPDNQLIVTASSDETAKIWEVASGKLLHSLESHSDWLTDACFSPDGQFVLTSSYDKTLRLWETASGKEVSVFKGHTDAVMAIAFNHDGDQLASASKDGTARLWNKATGKVLKIFKAHSEGLTDVAFSPDSTQLLTASADKTAKVWDISTGQVLLNLEPPTGEVWCAAFSLNGKLIATGTSDGILSLWDTQNGNKISDLAGEKLTWQNVYTDDKETAKVATTFNKDTKAFEIALKSSQTPDLKDHLRGINQLAFCPDGKSLAIASDDRSIKIYVNLLNWE